MNPTELMDSKRFCHAAKSFAVVWARKRGGTEAERLAALETFLGALGEKMMPEKPILPAKMERPKEVSAPVNMGEDHGLPFDPFEEPDIPLPPQPTKEEIMAAQRAMLAEALAKAKVSQGSKFTFVLPADFNANELGPWLKEIGGWMPAENAVMPTGQGGNWKIEVIKL